MKDSLKVILKQLIEGQTVFYIYPPEFNKPMKVEITEILIDREWKEVQVKCIDDGFQMEIDVPDDSPTFGYEAEYEYRTKKSFINAKGQMERYNSEYFVDIKDFPNKLD